MQPGCFPEGPRRAFAHAAVWLTVVALCACLPAKRRVWPRTPPPIRAERAYAGPVLPAGAKPGRRVVIHQPFRDVLCGTCHVNPRGGGVLVSSADRLCKGCHAKSIARATIHPAMSRSCLECHAPHVSMEEGLLAGTEARICTRCHEADSPKLVRAHQGYPVARARCTRCHDPHGHDGDRPLRASVHRPAARCTNCHVAATDEEPLALIRPERETCGGCHPEANPEAETAYEHAPFGARCSDCHDPHGSDRPHLLRSDEKTLCLGCHADLGDKLAMPLPHAPAGMGRCHACHSPHGSDQPALLAASVPALCTGCHVRWHETPESAGAPREGDVEARCLYCHDPHGSGRPGLLKHERRVADAGR